MGQREPAWPVLLPRPSYEMIQDVVLRFFNIPGGCLGDTAQGKRTPDRALARELISLLAREIRNMSAPELRDAMGLKSHTLFVCSRRSWSRTIMDSAAGRALYLHAVQDLKQVVRESEIALHQGATNAED